MSPVSSANTVTVPHADVPHKRVTALFLSVTRTSPSGLSRPPGLFPTLSSDVRLSSAPDAGAGGPGWCFSGPHASHHPSHPGRPGGNGAGASRRRGARRRPRPADAGLRAQRHRICPCSPPGSCPGVSVSDFPWLENLTEVRSPLCSLSSITLFLNSSHLPVGRVSFKPSF